MNNDAEDRLAEQQRKQEINSAVRARQNAKTADALRTASNVAANSGNAYAKAAGTAINAADKLTGGKSTEALSNVLNKTSVGRIAGRVGSSAAGKLAGNAIAAKNGSKSNDNSVNNMAKKADDARNKTRQANDVAKKNKDKENVKSSLKNNKSKSKELDNSKSSDLDEEVDLQEKKSFAFDVFFATIGAPLILTALAVVGLVLPFVIIFSAIDTAVGDYEEKMDTIMQSDAYMYAHIANPTFVIADIMYSAKTGNDVGIVSKFKDLKEKFGSLKIDTILNIGNNFNTKDENGVCEGTNCSSRVEVLFTQKAMDINSRYKKLYGIDLDWPLIISTIIINSDDKAETFKENVSDYDRKEIEKKDVVMPIDWEYDYKNIPGYSYLSGEDSRYDMQILAKNMVKKTTTQTCKDKNGKDLVEPLVLEDVEDSLIDEKLDNGNYLECKNGTYKINSTYKLDKDKYDEFLDEYIEMKYFVNKDGTYYAASNGSGSGSGSGSGGTTVPGNIPTNVNIPAKNGYSWPLTNTSVTSDFGAPRGLKIHCGIDFKAEEGTPVYAIADGVVQNVVTNCTVGDSGCGQSGGNHVYINHENGTYSSYMHGSKVLVNVGQRVKRGELIMLSGNTGQTSGPHLHLGMKATGQSHPNCENGWINPWPYIGR